MESPRLLFGPPALPPGGPIRSDLDYYSNPYAVRPELPSDLETDGLLDYLHLLIRNRGKLLFAFVLGIIAAVLLTLPQTPVYRARTTLEIQGVNNAFLNNKQINPMNDDGSNSNVMADIQTQIKIINSEFLVDRVVDHLKAAGKLTSIIPRQEGSWWRTLLHLHSAGPSDFPEEFRRTALKNLTVSQISQTRVIEVYFKAFDPKLAAEFVNQLDIDYIDSSVQARGKMSEQTGTWLSHQIDDIRGKLEQSELNLQRYARSAGLLFTSGQLGNPDRSNVSDDKLHQMQEELSRAHGARIQAQSYYDVAKLSEPDTLADVLNDPSLRDLRRQITDWRRQEAELGAIYTPKSEKVQRIEVQLVTLEAAFQKQRTAILDRIKSDYERAVRHERLLQTDYDTQIGVVLEQADKSIRYNLLKRDVDTNRQLYESMLQQVKAASVASAMRASNIRIVDPAKKPEQPYAPNMKINAALGGIAGLVFGALFVLVRRSTDRTLQQPGEMQFWTKLSELGVIPSRSIEDGDGGSRRNGSIIKMRLTLPWRTRPDSHSTDISVHKRKPNMLTEAFRTVLTSVLFAGANGSRPRVLVVTSANPSEGKTTITTNLALALAEIRQKVLIIDADLRKPRMHQIFELDNARGLSTLLTEGTFQDELISSLIQKTDTEGLSVLSSGPPTTSAANLLHSPHLQELLTKCKAKFDMILIDTPPAIQLTDSRIIGRVADAVILVTRAGHTTRDAAMAVASRFNEDRTHLLGSILNDWRPESPIADAIYYSRYTHAGSYGREKVDSN